ncbi:hypothetical protein SAMN04489841_0687 [Natrinema salaciae]|uniref:Uncharacterized protein n=1 Tax=Natrinema salaciae TaxID=1186196 RepID=A0A1H9BBE1_9EURY|nr:hypothetical protein SAMN04489841_0687 [Natrinema salaciae]
MVISGQMTVEYVAANLIVFFCFLGDRREAAVGGARDAPRAESG